MTPTYNERNNLLPLISAVHAVAPACHMLVVDDASPDGTGDLADQLAREDSRVHVLHRAGKMGLGTAYVDGFRYGLARDYDTFVQMDADLSHDPVYLPSFLQALSEGADVVIGSRNIAGGGVRGWGLGRHVLSKGGSAYSRIVLGVGVHDLTTGYKAYTRNALRTIEVESIRSNGYSYQIETTYRALRRGLSVVELPIVFVDRRAGQSKMSRAVFLEAVVMVWKLRRDALVGRL